MYLGQNYVHTQQTKSTCTKLYIDIKLQYASFKCLQCIQDINKQYIDIRAVKNTTINVPQCKYWTSTVASLVSLGSSSLARPLQPDPGSCPSSGSREPDPSTKWPTQQHEWPHGTPAVINAWICYFPETKAKQLMQAPEKVHNITVIQRINKCYMCVVFTTATDVEIKIWNTCIK